MIQTRIQHCTNCGLPGHLFRSCLSPVTSYGVIAVRYQDDQYATSLFSKTPTINNGYQSIQFLLIQRKDTLSFVEFIRGKYSSHDDAHLCTLLAGMTQHEHQMILTMTFPELWFAVWGESSSSRSHKNDYESSERRYAQIADRLHDIVRAHPTQWTEPEWGFPKGRRNPYETDMGCAMREFQEESGLSSNDYCILQNTHSISETFFGTNQIHYCHKYYIAICQPSIEVKMNENNLYMSREVRDIKWCTIDDAMSKIRPDNVEKREILLKAGKIMKNFHPVSIYDRTTYR